MPSSEINEEMRKKITPKPKKEKEAAAVQL
jgi:hypothetical protein